jgi:hypothetical protein
MRTMRISSFVQQTLCLQTLVNFSFTEPIIAGSFSAMLSNNSKLNMHGLGLFKWLSVCQWTVRQPMYELVHSKHLQLWITSLFLIRVEIFWEHVPFFLLAKYDEWWLYHCIRSLQSMPCTIILFHSMKCPCKVKWNMRNRPEFDGHH